MEAWLRGLESGEWVPKPPTWDQVEELMLACRMVAGALVTHVDFRDWRRGGRSRLVLRKRKSEGQEGSYLVVERRSGVIPHALEALLSDAKVVIENHGLWEYFKTSLRGRVGNAVFAE
jgi:hypothetical protein